VAATQQYCEVLPGAEGSGTPLGGGSITSEQTPTLEDVLPPELVEQLRAAGPEGEEMLKLPAPQELLAPDGTLTPEGRAAFEAAVEALLADDLAASPPARGSVLSAMGAAASDGGALSPELRWGLVGSLVGLAAISLGGAAGGRALRPRFAGPNGRRRRGPQSR
jgi:hypothetical protein